MRLYTFINYYLSDIQRGIQTAHVVSELFSHYETPSQQRDDLNCWAYKHKTIVVLNGGNSQTLDAIRSILAELVINKYPYASFHEDEQSLNGALTCVGVVVPTKIIDYNDAVRINPTEAETLAGIFELTASDVELANLIRSYPLA